MILSYRDKETERFSLGERVKRFEAVERTAQIKLDVLRTAESLPDLQNIRGNRFEKLRGDRSDRYSIRINDQWRICFMWDSANKGFTEVEIVDYHS